MQDKSIYLLCIAGIIPLYDLYSYSMLLTLNTYKHKSTNINQYKLYFCHPNF